jgi:uncharacterized protein involved in type VI secretion and phage assembly
MSARGPFALPAHWLAGAQIGLVTAVRDPEGLGRVQVRLTGPDADGTALMWARTVVPFAGNNRGAFLIPDVSDEVLVVFIAGDPRWPVVLGGMWNGRDTPPESLDGERVDRWSLTGTNGTRIAIVEEAEGRESVEIETPSGVSARLTDAGGGALTLEAAGSTVRLDASGVAIDTGGKVSVHAGSVEVAAGEVRVNAAFAQFSGIVSCDTLIANSVISGSYTPGTGNIW